MIKYSSKAKACNLHAHGIDRVLEKFNIYHFDG